MLTMLPRRFVSLFFRLLLKSTWFACLVKLLALQGHAPVLCNPPQPEDADILEEPGASAADGAALIVDAEAELPGTGDSEDSNPFRVKRSRPLSAEDLDVSSYAVPPATPSSEPSPSASVAKRTRFGRLTRPRAG